MRHPFTALSVALLAGMGQAQAGGTTHLPPGEGDVPVVDLTDIPESASIRNENSQGKPHQVQARLMTDRAPLHPGETFRLGVHLEQDPGWHTYWRSPGDIGLPTDIDWTVPDGAETTDYAYPAPRRFELQTIVSYGYDDQVLFYTEVTLPQDLAPGTIDLGARASWLVCEVQCIPGEVDLKLPVEVVAPDEGDPADRSTAQAPLFDHFQELHPVDPTTVPELAFETALSASAVRPEESFTAVIQVTPTGAAELKPVMEVGAYPAFVPIISGDYWMLLDSQVQQTDGGGLRVRLEGETFAVDPLPTDDKVGGLFQLQVGDRLVRTEITMPLDWVAAGEPVAASASPLLVKPGEDGAGTGGGTAEGEDAAASGAEPVSPAGADVSFLRMLILAFLFAVWLNTPVLRFRAFFRAVFFLPSVTPMVVIAIVFSLIFGL
ncbi:MAG: protein-disulfide reductase DsbD family protein, partial [Myxococcota bacterium]|nr:protein-disulfide reductase DsbD family protein [Myxococcota bacterium]